MWSVFDISFYHRPSDHRKQLLCRRAHFFTPDIPDKTVRPVERWDDGSVTYAYADGQADSSPARTTIQVVAHRGASEDAPEHTLAAYRKAIEDGTDALECDVRLTADGHLVCVHDRRVNRTSNGRGAVSALELRELAALDFGSWKDADDTDATDVGDTGGWAEDDPYESPDWESDPNERSAVLTLERLLELVTGAGRRIDLAIETKHPTRWAGQVEERLLELLGRFGLRDPRNAPVARSRVRVMSFSARSLRRIQAGAPELPTVYLMSYLLPRYRDGRLPANAAIAGPGIRILRGNPGYVERVHRAGHRVHVWTVDEPGDVELCVRLGVDAIITNRPKQVLTQLGR
jgi:glycerophosphoryl diester phosphodiesterase